MDIRLVQQSLRQNESDTRVLVLWEGQKLFNSIEYLDEESKNIVDYILNESKFTGKFGEIESFRLPRKKNPNKLIIVGLGNTEKFDFEKYRKIIAKIIKEGNQIKSTSIETNPIVTDRIPLEDSIRIISETSILASYKFDKYKKEKKESSVKELVLIHDEEQELEKLNMSLDEGIALGKATVFARDLVNEPANVLTPVELAKRAERMAKESGLEVEIYDENVIKELRMKAFLEVTRASDIPPRLIVMRYFGDRENKDNIIGLVGKGITYDSGGLSLKPKDSMINMKNDMGGAAAVIGAMNAIAEIGLKINVVAVVAACENMVSGKAYRPGDIIESMAGKTIFIKSTDAEGRLTLIDAVHYIIEKERAEKVVDIATLTGGAIYTLGTLATPVLSNDDEFYNKLEQASRITGEKIWRLPCFDEYKEQNKYDIADLINSGGHPQTITAGLFIGEFVQDKPWIHMDIAGTAWSSKDIDYIKKGGTGVGVRTLYYLTKGLNQ